MQKEKTLTFDRFAELYKETHGYDAFYEFLDSDECYRIKRIFNRNSQDMKIWVDNKKDSPRGFKNFLWRLSSPLLLISIILVQYVYGFFYWVVVGNWYPLRKNSCIRKTLLTWEKLCGWNLM